MRPHKLVMKAFGPFAKETTVDFDQLGDSIYLVAGETGAGKTMIFDAMSYALFGCASGERREDLDGEDLHCDLCVDGNHKDPLLVDFTFSNAGKDYHVRRTVSWGAKGTNQKAEKESLLEYDGITIRGTKKEKKDDVTARIIEILGLDANQFHRLIMLAQGEFQKFLESGSDERAKIIGKIYNNSRHMDLECRVKNLNSRLEKRLNETNGSIKQQLTFFKGPDDITEEELSMLNPERSELFETLTALNVRIEAELSACNESQSMNGKALEALLGKETAAKINNGQLADLKTKEGELSALVGEKSAYDALEIRVRLAEKAQKVLPAEEAFKGEQEHLQQLVDRLDKLDKTRAGLAEELKKLTADQRRITEENKPLIETLSQQIFDLQNKLSTYDELEKSLEISKEKDAAAASAKEMLQQEKDMLAGIAAREEELKKELLALADAGQASVDNAKTKLENAENREKSVETLSRNVEDIKQLLTDRETSEINVSHLADLAQKDLDKYSDVSNRFIAGQADILADDMIEKLRKGGLSVIPCPVCGSEHTLEEMENRKTGSVGSVPTKAQVDKAMKAYDDSRNAYTEAKEELGKLNAAIGEKQSAALEEASKLLDISDWTQLEDERTLEHALDACAEQKKTVSAALEKAEEDKKAKEDLEKENGDISGKKSAQEAKVNDAVQNHSTADKAAAVARETVENNRKLLTGFPASKADAESSINDKEAEKVRLQALIVSAAQAIETCSKSIASNDGSISSASGEKTDSESRIKLKEQEFSDTLSAQGFDAIIEYEAALSPEGVRLDKADLDKWIAAKGKSLNNYKERLTQLKAAVDQLKETTKGMVETDLTLLDNEIKALRALQTSIDEKSKKLSVMHQTNVDVISRIGNSLGDKAKLEKISLLIKPLSDKAVGKLAFSRYVLYDFFSNIIEQANIHLATMTDGEFSFIRPEVEDGRSAQGLNLALMNNFTGAVKKFASISGGQTFEASLAMALGLSEMVQLESASTIQIDSMFIDEGFGSLGPKDLNRAMDVLKRLSDGKKQIGIISHVEALEEYLPNKITVTRGREGSEIS